MKTSPSNTQASAEAKPTPGPWTVIDTDVGKSFTKNWREISPGVVSACFYETNRWGETETVSGVRITEANARLIAAAPELLDALCAALPFVEDALKSEDFKPGYVEGRAAMIRNAIAKATLPPSNHSTKEGA